MIPIFPKRGVFLPRLPVVSFQKEIRKKVIFGTLPPSHLRYLSSRKRGGVVLAAPSGSFLSKRNKEESDFWDTAPSHLRSLSSRKRGFLLAAPSGSLLSKRNKKESDFWDTAPEPSMIPIFPKKGFLFSPCLPVLSFQKEIRKKVIFGTLPPSHLRSLSSRKRGSSARAFRFFPFKKK